MTEASYCLGVDLGQAADYTAICVIEKPATPLILRPAKTPQPKPVYNLRYLERLPLGTTYPEVAKKIKELVETPPLKDHVTVIADATGVGVAVMDVLRAEKVTPLIPVTITGGDQASSDSGAWRVPKRDLVMSLLVLLQNERLKIADGLAMGDALMSELLNFRQKIDRKTAHDSYSAWREGDHDDLVLSVSLAAWWADRFGRFPDPIPGDPDGPDGLSFGHNQPRKPVSLVRDWTTGKVSFRRGRR